MYYAYIVKVKELKKHPNADRLQIANFFGNETIVGLNVNIGDMGIYFPCDGQVSLEYATENNLLRKKDENGNNIGGMLEDNRRIKTIKLRGERSDGLYMPITSLAYTAADLDSLTIGEPIDVLNGHEICKKYEVQYNTKRRYTSTSRARSNELSERTPTFQKHVETEQLAYNLDRFKAGDVVEITLKMHGTSGRTGYLLTRKDKTAKEKFLDFFKKNPKDKYEYDYVTGTRNVVLDRDNMEKGKFYDNEMFRWLHSDRFKGKLFEGETVYYEIVGYTTNGSRIMPSASNKSLGKEFMKKYGETTEFSYGCDPNGTLLSTDHALPQSEIYVYRMTLTTPEGYVVEYPFSLVQRRCSMMGFNTVPLLDKFIVPNFETQEKINDYVLKKAEEWYDGIDPIGRTHIREGVVLRRVERTKMDVYKHKNFNFKVLSGVAIANVEEKDSNGNSEFDADMLSEM